MKGLTVPVLCFVKCRSRSDTVYQKNLIVAKEIVVLCMNIRACNVIMTELANIKTLNESKSPNDTKH